MSRHLLLSVVIFSFSFCGKFQITKTLTVSSSVICLSMCLFDETCRGYRFLKDFYRFGELVLSFKKYSSLLDPFLLIDKTEETSFGKVAIFRSRKASQSELQDKAAAAGFDIALELLSEKVFLKHMTTPMSIQEAQFACLGHGGLLPLEDSDNFIDAMSDLVGDPTSTRFTSLVREIGNSPNQPHLVWQTGRVESTKVGPSEPRYTSWNDRFFVVNPATKTYQSVSSTTLKSEFYCQYMGTNIALSKATYASTTAGEYDQGSGMVDGVIGMNFWHTNGYSQLQKEWFAVDLGGNFLVSSVLFLGRRDCCGERCHFMKVWIGQVIPPDWQHLNPAPYELCGEYPYIQQTGYLSGIECVNRIMGQVVILENGSQQMQLTEMLIF